MSQKKLPLVVNHQTNKWKFFWDILYVKQNAYKISLAGMEKALGVCWNYFNHLKIFDCFDT